MSHAYDDLITNVTGCTDYWRLDRDTDELANLKNALRSDLTSSNVTSGSTAEDILPGTNNLYSDYFDGSSAYVTGTTSQYADVTGGSFTVEAWIKPASVDALTDFVGIVVKNGSFGLCLNYGKLAFFTQLSGQSKIIASDTSVASADTVYHVVGSYNASTGHHSIYVDGVEVGYYNGSTGSQADDNASNLVIGSWDTSVLFFNGRISNVALYSAFMAETTAYSHYTWNA